MSRFVLTLKEPQRLVGLLWPLALLTPFIPWLPRPADGGFPFRQELSVALILSLAFALLLRRAADARPDFPTTATRFSSTRLSSILLASFVAWSACSVLWATNVFASAHYALSWVVYLLLFLLLTRACASARALRGGLAVLGACILVIGAANVIGHLGTPHSLLRQHGLGEPVAVSIPLFAALALHVRRRRFALLSGIVAALAWLTVLQIAERGSFIAVSVGLLVLAATTVATPRFRPRTMMRAVLLALAFAACLAAQHVPTPFEQSAHSNVLTRLTETTTADPNARARFLYWGAAFELWRAHPLAGVGAGNFSTRMPEARAAFAASHPGSTLSGLNEKFLNAGAHNEYLQILSELGAVGLLLFVAFCLTLVWSAWRALRSARGPLVPGAVASLAVFAVSSGASMVSFRWMGSGLMFVFAASIVTHFAARSSSRERATIDEKVLVKRLPALPRPSPAIGLALALVVACVMTVQAVHVQLIAAAQSAPDAERAEQLYRLALKTNPLNPSAHYQLGVWLFYRGREREAVPFLRYGVERGYNSSTCYAYLAGAESNAGDVAASERTLTEAVRVFPRSVFLRARHAAALARLNRADEAELEMTAALLLDSRAARGWRSLIDDDIDAAVAAARREPGRIAVPGELEPDDAVFAVLKENEKRFPEAVHTGWRARMRSN